MDQLTAEEMERLRALYEAAKPGEWVREGFRVRSTSENLTVCNGGTPDIIFIAAAHNALPKLLDRIEALEAELALLRAGG